MRYILKNLCFSIIMSIPECFTVTRTSTFSTRMTEELMSMKNHKKLMDFKIHTGDQTIPCHRLVLCLHSPVLKAMITSDMAEGTNQEVHLDTIPFPVMNMLADICIVEVQHFLIPILLN